MSGNVVEQETISTRGFPSGNELNVPVGGFSADVRKRLLVGVIKGEETMKKTCRLPFQSEFRTSLQCKEIQFHPRMCLP